MYVSDAMLYNHTDPRCDAMEPEDGLVWCTNPATVFPDDGSAYCENCAPRFIRDRNTAVAIINLRDAGLL